NGEDQSFETLLEGFDSRLGKNELAAAKDVVNIDALHWQNVDVRDVRSRALEVHVDLCTADEECIFKTELGELRNKLLRLGFRCSQIIDDDQVRCLCLCRQGMTQAKSANLLRQIVIVRTDNRSVSLTTAAELRCASRMVTSAARTLLLVHLGAGAAYVATALSLMGALLAASQLPAHDALKNVVTRVEAEDFFVQLDLAGILAFKSGNREIHYSAPSVATASAFAAPARRAAGFGAFSGSETFTASRTMIQAPLEPGTAPRTKIRPRSLSVETTSIFCVVTRVWPM